MSSMSSVNHVVMTPLLSYSGERQKHKATPTDQNLGCQQQLRLTQYKDHMLLVTLPNCLTRLWTAVCQLTSWQSTLVFLPRTPSVTIMRMCHVQTGRAALSQMTFMRPVKLRADAAAVRLVGWKMRSMDNTVDAPVNFMPANEYDPARQRNTFFLYTWLVTCVVQDY